jgi:hypothetical protein
MQGTGEQQMARSTSARSRAAVAVRESTRTCNCMSDGPA